MTNGTWLVTGGAGYIGAHVVRALQHAGCGVVVLDDLSTGRAERVGVPLVRGEAGDGPLVREVLDRFHVRGVIHLAAEKEVADSVRRPVHYYRRNLGGLVEVLDAVAAAGVERLVYSSSAAVYGAAEGPLVSEDAATVPINPYGETKLAGEWLIRAQAAATGLRFAALRYFNVAGAGAPELGDLGESNLIPLVLRAIEDGAPPRIFGDDYPTPDGTCVRDYVHVQDLARAHVEVISLLDAPGGQVLNVGTGAGHSVRAVVDVAAQVTGRDITPEVIGRRAGDPPSVVADAARIMARTSWRAKYDLHDMVRDAWTARRARDAPAT